MASQSDDRATSPDPASPSARDPHNDQPHVDDHQPDASIKASRSVTIEERSVSPSSRAMRTESQVTANTVSTIATTSSFDPLHQYQKALEYLERKNQFVEKERKRREDKERSEAPHHPFLSLYVQNAIKKGERSTRTVIDVAEANDEWEKQRRQHLQKKRNMVEKERAEEYAQHKHVDAHSEQICQQKGHLPIHKSWQEVQKIQAQRREKLAQMLKPTFAPETYSHLESRRARSVAARPTAKSGLLNERSRSQVAERLHKEFQRRVERRERELKEMEEAKQTQEKELEERVVGHTKRTKEEIDEHLELLSQWHQRKEAVQELRRKLHDDDINLTFQPYVSQYSRHLAIAARYHHPVEVPPPPPKRNHSKPRNRRVENIKPANVARCKPLPHAFLVRSERMLAAKEQRTKELLRRDEEMHVKSCTFAPSINPVSDAIMRLTSPASTPQGPRFMKPTEAAVRRATPSEEALHVDDAHLYRSDSFAHAHGHPQQHAHQSAPAYQHTASSSDQYDSVQRRSRQAEPLGRSPSLRSDAPASPAPKTAPVHHDGVHATDVPLTLGDKFEEMRATLALWNQLANAASP